MSRYLVLLVGVSLWCQVAHNLRADSHPANWEAADAQLRTRVDKLIQQLGSPEFARREQAAAELNALGLAAFDALHRAQNDEDAEIRWQARHLVRSLRVAWARPDDPEPVKQVLRRYASHNASLRASCISRLAELGGLMGLEPLCRLVRFEPSENLSKQAALRIMRHELPEGPARRVELITDLRRTIGTSERPAANWVRTYLDWLSKPVETLDRWNALIEAEERALDRQAGNPGTARIELPPAEPLATGGVSDATFQDAEIFDDLLRWYADVLRGMDRVPEAEAVMRRLVARGEDSREGLIEIVDWLIDRRAWSVVDEVVRKHAAEFRDDPLLLYRQAEALQKQGQPEKAEEAVRRALDLNKTEPGEHVLAAYSLEKRGLLDWAIGEYRHVLELAEAGSIDDLRARLLLSELLHDQARDEEAAVVLRAAVDQMETNPAVLHRMGQMEREPASVKSRMHYFYAEHFRQQADRDPAAGASAAGVRGRPQRRRCAHRHVPGRAPQPIMARTDTNTDSQRGRRVSRRDRALWPIRIPSR
jgi:tetratricopeptide (TPR) repeat protein